MSSTVSAPTGCGSGCCWMIEAWHVTPCIMTGWHSSVSPMITSVVACEYSRLSSLVSPRCSPLRTFVGETKRLQRRGARRNWCIRWKWAIGLPYGIMVGATWLGLVQKNDRPGARPLRFLKLQCDHGAWCLNEILANYFFVLLWKNSKQRDQYPAILT